MTNPRAKFMSELKSLCRDFEKQVDEVEKETRVTLNHSRVMSNLAADKWKDEVMSLGAQIRAELESVEDNRIHLSSFLDNMNQEMRRMVEQTQRAQSYMSQYGYQAKTIDEDKLLDWETNTEEENEAEQQEDVESGTTPAAASEFDEEKRVEEERKVETKASAISSPSIFDLGLSKYGLSKVLGKNLTKDDEIVKKTEAAAMPVPSARPPSPKLPPAPDYHEESLLSSVPSSLILDESKYDSSPILKMNSRPLKTMMDDSNIDITPGLMRARPVMSSATLVSSDTPEMPSLITDVKKKESRPAESPVVSSHKPPVKMTDTPEMPELTTDIRKLMATRTNRDPGVKSSRPTPEYPDLVSIKKSDPSTVLNTPDTPELTSVKY